MIKNVLKEKKFWIWLVVIYALVLILLGSLIIPSANRHNDAIKKISKKLSQLPLRSMEWKMWKLDGAFRGRGQFCPLLVVCGECLGRRLMGGIFRL